MDYMTTAPDSNNDDQIFQYSIFNNRFFYDNGFEPSFESLSSTNVESYPNGISPFGLYDVIGNLPELVKYDNKYWIVGTTPAQAGLQSFCSDDGNGTIFENNFSQAEQISKSANDNFNIELPIYGLRLIRTTQ
jgi:formylglycine-generating enzyme required for sulfatase activity